MAKTIRSIKADMRRDETIGKLSRDARYLFVLLFGTYVDDFGRFRANPALLRGELYPYDDDVTRDMVTCWLDELVRAKRVRLYVVDGQQYAVLVNWAKHQRIDNAAKSELPEPPAADSDLESTLLPDPPPVAASCGEPPKVDPVDNETAAGVGKERSRRGVGKETVTSAADAAFGEFWQLYPASRRIDRKKCNVYFRKAVAGGVEPATILASLAAWVAYWEPWRNDDKYIVQSTRWLNEARWETVPTASPALRAVPEW